jgi:hypothetical protein
MNQLITLNKHLKLLKNILKEETFYLFFNQNKKKTIFNFLSIFFQSFLKSLIINLNKKILKNK